MTTLRRTFLAIAMGLAATLAQAATPVPDGKWSFIYRDAKLPNKPVRVYTYRPRDCDTTCPIVIALHGVNRHASQMRDNWELPADRYKLIVVAPELLKKDWAGYNLGGAKDDERDFSAFALIERLFDEVRDGQPDYVLFGHSAGGQFAHRFAIFQQPNRARVIAAANPGWYAMPEWRKDKGAEPYPYSLLDSPAGEAQLRSALSRPFILLLGEKDTDEDAENLSQSAGAKKQGATRLDRGETFFSAATAAAATLGLPMKWELVEVPGVGHEAGKMANAASHAIFDKKK